VGAMFFPVTIYGPDGKIKKVLSPKTLEKRHWSKFNKTDRNRSFSRKAKKDVPQQLKEKLDLYFFKLDERNYH
jgi:hypothetical protein|tara:strand:- start:190 stop:408 length:219 start_codon:yes stop_codon:yes gene_type:complete